MIPMEVVDSEGTVSSDITKVSDKWKSEYSTLLNQQRGVIADGSSHESCSPFENRFVHLLVSRYHLPTVLICRLRYYITACTKQTLAQYLYSIMDL
jgi:hypothetical protein